MGMIIRVLYNNQDWKAPCITPGKDVGCWNCLESYFLGIEPPSRDDEVCTGHCWEQHLCTEYKWGCTPKGRMFSYRAYRGMKVFLVFRQPSGFYTLWGKTTVRDIDDTVATEGRDYEVGFAFIHLEPFEPLPKEKWVSNLKDVQLAGEMWLMGRYRYIDEEKEAYLEKLIEGEVPEEQVETPVTIPTSNSTSLSINVTPNIYKKLESIANEEGRQIDEIVREAVAEWIKERGS